MNILFTICGRAGSKGFKNKNLKAFLGIPLVYYSLAAVSLYIEKNIQKGVRADAVLNTDSEELIQIVSEQKIVPVNVIRREADLGGDAVPKVAVIRDCLLRMEEISGTCYDVVVDLDITSPLRTVQDIEAAISKKVSRTDTDVVYSVTDSRRNPYFNMVKEEDGFFLKAISSNFTARQQAPRFYDMNASIYVYSTQALKKKEPQIFFNDKCDAILMKDTGVLDIDSEEDFELMQVIAEFILQKDDEYKEISSRAKNI